MRYVLLLPLLAAAVCAAAFAQTKKLPEKTVIRSGQVVSCQVEKECSQQVVNGRRVYAMDVRGLRVWATLGQDQRISYADLKIENKTASALNVLPEDFRIEVDDLKFKRLSYVDPAGKRHAQLERVEELEGNGLPASSYWTSVEHKEAKEARLAAQSSKVPLLPMGPVAAGSSITGRVYFERPSGTSDRSLILPFREAILEFPFPKPEVTAKKGKKNADQTAAAPVLQE